MRDYVLNALMMLIWFSSRCRTRGNWPPAVITAAPPDYE